MKTIERPRSTIGKLLYDHTPAGRREKEKTKDELMRIFLAKALSETEQNGFTALKKEGGNTGFRQEGLFGNVVLTGPKGKYLITVAARMVRDTSGEVNRDGVHMNVYAEDWINLSRVTHGIKRSVIFANEHGIPAEGDKGSRRDLFRTYFSKAKKTPERYSPNESELGLIESIDFLRELIDATVDNQATLDQFEIVSKDEIMSKYNPTWVPREIFWNKDRPGEFRRFVASAKAPTE